MMAHKLRFTSVWSDLLFRNSGRNLNSQHTQSEIKEDAEQWYPTDPRGRLLILHKNQLFKACYTFTCLEENHNLCINGLQIQMCYR
jgi:hypothetical protein